MDSQPLTPEEIAKLRALIPVAEKLREEAEFNIAWQLVKSRGRSIILGLAAVVAAVLVIWTAVKNGWQALIGG